jgi:hypothetical protein
LPQATELYGHGDPPKRSLTGQSVTPPDRRYSDRAARAMDHAA